LDVGATLAKPTIRRGKRGPTRATKVVNYDDEEEKVPE
jgi:hypothetical protein